MARRGLPRSVDVCGVRIRVRRPAKVINDDQEECFGTFDRETCTIDVQRGLTPELEGWTFRHEIGHASFDHSGFEDFLAHFIPDAEKRRQVEEQAIKTWLPAYDAALRLRAKK